MSSELKQLYVLCSRAKSTVLFYEPQAEAAKPMIELWTRQELIETIPMGPQVCGLHLGRYDIAWTTGMTRALPKDALSRHCTSEHGEDVYTVQTWRARGGLVPFHLLATPGKANEESGTLFAWRVHMSGPSKCRSRRFWSSPARLRSGSHARVTCSTALSIVWPRCARSGVAISRWLRDAM